jgi:HlyD family secretion protein
VVVPIQSVVDRGEDDQEKKKYVLLADKDKVRQVEVKTGISDATHVVVTSGIKAGDQVITGPFRTLKTLKDDDRIVVTKETTGSSKTKKKTKDDEDEEEK